MEITLGQKISTATSLIDQVGSEINSMLNLTMETFNKQFRASKDQRFLDWDSDWVTSDSEWVLSDTAHYVPVLKKGGRNPVRYLVIQVSLSGDGISGEGFQNVEPLIHVYFFACPVSFEEGDYFGFPFANEWGKPVLIDEAVWFWTEDQANPIEQPWDKNEWGFSVLLTSINTLDDIKDKIVDPALMLIKNPRTGIEQLSSLDGVIRYKKVNDLYRLVPHRS
jgi:hypothetical protein